MLLVQMTGLSGAGKTTIATGAQHLLREKGYKVEVIDGDEFRKVISRDLGFSADDRKENIRRLGFIAALLARNGVIAILSAINPYEQIRQEIQGYGPHVRTVWIDCPLKELVRRDTKGLYRRAFLPLDSNEKISNLTGINDPYEVPISPDLILNTSEDLPENSIRKFFNYVLEELNQRNGS